MRAVIVGYGRAGRVQLDAIRQNETIQLVGVVDERESLGALLDAGIPFEPSPLPFLLDATVDAVVVTTPTATHYDVCKLAIEHGKHVFVEKPIATSTEEVDRLYALAEERGVLLYTAFNRRHDPEWARLREELDGAYPLSANVVCRDHPFPPAAYLQTCGGIFRDAAVHDLDMLCTLLEDTPVEVDARLDAAGENGSVVLLFSKGCRVHMVHSRHAPSYEQRVLFVLPRRIVEMAADPDAEGLTFQARYRDSYRLQMADFATRVATGVLAPNVTRATAHFLERLIEACDASAATGAPVALQGLRAYEASKTRVYEVYRAGRRSHTVDATRRLLRTYAPRQFGTKTLSEVMDALRTFVDLSDPDVDVPNHQHALQTAESIRRAGLPDWLQLVGLIHDFGKILHAWGADADGTSAETQWALVGDTFVVGHPLPPTLVHPELNAEQPPAPSIYEPHCGLDACLLSFGHDEYLYRVLLASDTTLPPVAAKIVRYHSLYAWHERDAYAELEREEDALLKGWVKLFNQHDLYSKRHAPVDEERVWPHYAELERRYLPHGLRF